MHMHSQQKVHTDHFKDNSPPLKQVLKFYNRVLFLNTCSSTSTSKTRLKKNLLNLVCAIADPNAHVN